MFQNAIYKSANINTWMILLICNNKIIRKINKYNLIILLKIKTNKLIIITKKLKLINEKKEEIFLEE